jgi:iron complex transport system ATP-binding protein
METIKLENLTIGYKDKVVQSNLNAAFESGQLVCLLGRNGIGKSTLLRTLAMFQPALGGEVILEEKALNSYSVQDLSRKLSIVLTRKPDVQNITVSEMVGLGRSPYTGFWGTLHDADKTVVAEALRLVGIESMAERKIHTLSDGERQKVMIAKALAQQTPIILLDEPTAFLDFPSKVEILKLLGCLAKETDKTIILSTHDLELAARLADCLWQMDESGLKLVTPADVKHIVDSAIERTVVL